MSARCPFAFRKQILLSALALPTVAALALTGCDDDADALDMRVEVPFEIMVGDEVLEIGETYEGIGEKENTLTVSEAAFYVHDVRLIRADGAEISVELDQDAAFQLEDHVLLDFSEDSLAQDPSLTSNRLIVGDVAAGEYDGIAFRVGVDERWNHTNPATAPAPMNVESMAWSWTSGRKHMRIDAATDALEAFRLHLGSSRCEAPEADPGAATCQNLNTFEVEIDDFDVSTDTLVLDLATLFETSDLSTNQAESAPGCMSSPDDTDCAGVFEKIGLEHPAQETPPENGTDVFRLIR